MSAAPIRGPVVYGHVGVDGRILYIGRTNGLERRNNEHRLKSAWWPDVQYVRILARADCEAEERRLIAEHKPVKNLRGYTNEPCRALDEQVLRVLGTSHQIAKLLGVLRPATVRNWFQRGIPHGPTRWRVAKAAFAAGIISNIDAFMDAADRSASCPETER